MGWGACRPLSGSPVHDVTTQSGGPPPALSFSTPEARDLRKSETNKGDLAAARASPDMHTIPAFEHISNQTSFSAVKHPCRLHGLPQSTGKSHEKVRAPRTSALIQQTQQIRQQKLSSDRR
jgi:hypothetical protein